MLKKIYTSIERFLLSPAYFILFSLYPVFSLYVHNVHGVLVVDLFRPLLISVFFALFLYFCFLMTNRNSQTSALLVFLIYFCFFNYGDIRGLLGSLRIVTHDEVLAVIWLFLTALIFILISRRGKYWDVKTVAGMMNLMVIILLLFPTIRLLRYTVFRALPLERDLEHTAQINVNSNSPDIYYIILDAYTRSDELMRGYGYDNSSFINSLQGMGFYVAECSQSNYAMTSLSLSASLNMDYLQNISKVFQPGEDDLLYSFKTLDHNALRTTLSSAGYEIDAFASGFNWIEWRDADHFMSPPERVAPSEFEVVILLTSYARILDDFDIINFDDVHAEHFRERTRFVLDSFDLVVGLPTPKFVFIHIIAPHDPSGFDENGNNVMPDQVLPLVGYKNQSEFISKAIVPQIRKIIDQSANPPVIILQGDHGRYGSGPSHQMKILNAYYLPGHNSELYPSISPVNSFRVILNSYFGTDFPLLEDISYYSSLEHRYDFTVVPNTCP